MHLDKSLCTQVGPTSDRAAIRGEIYIQQTRLDLSTENESENSGDEVDLDEASSVSESPVQVQVLIVLQIV